MNHVLYTHSDDLRPTAFTAMTDHSVTFRKQLIVLETTYKSLACAIVLSYTNSAFP